MRLFILLAVLGGGAYVLYNHFQTKFTTLKAQAHQAKAKLMQALHARIELLRNLESQVGSSNNIGKNAVTTALRLAEKAGNTGDLAEVAILLDEKQDHLERASMQLRNPNLTADGDRLGPALDKLADNARELQLAKSEYNRNAKDFNHLATSGISGFIAPMMKMTPLPLCGYGE